MTEEKQIDEMAEMLEIIEKARDEYANDITDHSENEYIREGLLNAGYRKQSEGEWLIKRHPLLGDYDITCSSCGRKERRGRVWSESWGISNFCPDCGAKMKGGAK